MPPKSSLKRGSDILDPEEQFLASKNTTDVEVINLSTDGRYRCTRSRRDQITTSIYSRDNVFDMSREQDDPTLPSMPDISFDPEEILQPVPTEIPGLTIKTTQHTKRYLNSVRTLQFCR